MKITKIIDQREPTMEAPALVVPLNKCCDCGGPIIVVPDPPAVAKVKIKQAGERAELDERHHQERTSMNARHQEELQKAAEED